MSFSGATVKTTPIIILLCFLCIQFFFQSILTLWFAIIVLRFNIGHPQSITNLEKGIIGKFKLRKHCWKTKLLQIKTLFKIMVGSFAPFDLKHSKKPTESHFRNSYKHPLPSGEVEIINHEVVIHYCSRFWSLNNIIIWVGTFLRRR